MGVDIRRIDALEEHLHDELGDAFHGLVSAWDDDGITCEEHYLRDDIGAEYTEDDRAAMARETVFRAIEESHLEDVYHLGDRLFSLEYFERAALIIVAVSRTRGLVIGVEPDEARPQLAGTGRPGDPRRSRGTPMREEVINADRRYV